MSCARDLRANWRVLSIPIILMLTALAAQAGTSMLPRSERSLNGKWEIGLNRVYTQRVQVPGLVGDPASSTAVTLWYRRKVLLPKGDWNHAVLTLKGARFAPHVYVNGQMVSSSSGGMAPTVHLLRSVDVFPVATILLEVALKSDKDPDPQAPEAKAGEQGRQIEAQPAPMDYGACRNRTGSPAPW